MVQILWKGKREEGRRNDFTNREVGVVEGKTRREDFTKGLDFEGVTRGT